MSGAPVFIRAVGMACPLGLTVASACAAMRLGIDRKQELRYRTDDGEPIRGSMLAALGDDVKGRERWFQLLVRSLSDLGRHLQPSLLEESPVILVVPEAGCDAQRWLLPLLSRTLGRGFEPPRVQCMFGGSAAGYAGIAAARRRMLEEGVKNVIVCAADSLIDAQRLLPLSRGRRLVTENNPDGLLPGEAAVSLLLARERQEALAAVHGIGFGQEPGLLGNDVPLRGRGMTDAVRQALREAALGFHDMDVRLSDASGEAYHFKEQVLVVSRLLRQNKAEFPLWLPASTLGATGTAAGFCSIAQAVDAFRGGTFPGERAIACAGSDEGARAALVLARVARS